MHWGKAKMQKAPTIAVILGALLSSCAAPAAVPPPPQAAAAPAPVNPVRFSATGVASWYGREFHRKLTASGEPFNANAMTAAHRSLPLNTVVRVTNLQNGKSVLVRINDRGPYAGGRIIDLSSKAARVLDMQEEGKAKVRLEVYDADQTASL
jgi:rare lipoprotein A